MKPAQLTQTKTLAALIGSSLLATTTTAFAQDVQTEIQLLRQQTEALAAKISELEKQSAAAAAKPASAPVPAPDLDFKVTADAGGFGIASKSGDYAFKFKGLLQFDNRLYFSDDIPASQNRFVLRRLRPIFQGRIAKIYDFSLVTELAGGSANSSTVGLVDAWFSATPYEQFGVKLGKFVSPAALEPGSNVHFIESPEVNNLLPNRDIGIEAYGSTLEGLVSYRAGVFSGVRNNTNSFSVETNGGNKSFAGRLTFAPFISQKDSDLAAIRLSLGARIGFNTGGSGEGLQNYVTNGQQTLLNWGSVVAKGQQLQLNPAIEWYPKAPYSVVAEYALDHQRLANGATEFTANNHGWRVSGGYVITGENRTKAGVKPAKPFDWGGSNWGAFEVVARIGGISIDKSVFSDGGLVANPVNNASGALSYGVGLNWYLNDNVRVLANVENSSFRTPDGATSSRKDELYFFTRFQLSF